VILICDGSKLVLVGSVLGLLFLCMRVSRFVVIIGCGRLRLEYLIKLVIFFDN